MHGTFNECCSWNILVRIFVLLFTMWFVIIARWLIIVSRCTRCSALCYYIWLAQWMSVWIYHLIYRTYSECFGRIHANHNKHWISGGLFFFSYFLLIDGPNYHHAGTRAHWFSCLLRTVSSFFIILFFFLLCFSRRCLLTLWRTAHSLTIAPFHNWFKG